jgi:hypothetical protein
MAAILQRPLPMDGNRHDVPPGWDYNPSGWDQRLSIVALAVVGGLIAGYLALWQYGVVGRVWEPFFGDGSARILGSPLSFPLENHLGLDLPIRISDAALGALAYLLDAVFGLIGGRGRWRTMPWVVIVFAILVGPLGLVSLALVIAQPVIYGAWCTLCLTTAGISVIMIGPAMDEALASLQYMKRVVDRGQQSVWRAFLGIGDQQRIIPASRAPEPAPGRERSVASSNNPLRHTGTWAQGLAMLAGIATMAAPALLPYPEAATITARIVGPFIATFGCIAMWEATRPLRWVNVPLGAWLVAAPLLISHGWPAAVTSMASGAAVVLLSMVRGTAHDRFGGGWSAMWARDPYHVGRDAAGGPRVPGRSARA